MIKKEKGKIRKINLKKCICEYLVPNKQVTIKSWT